MAMPNSPGKHLNFLSNNNNENKGFEPQESHFGAIGHQKHQRDSLPGMRVPVGPPNLETGGQLTPFTNEHQTRDNPPVISLLSMQKNISNVPQVGSNRHGNKGRFVQQNADAEFGMQTEHVSSMNPPDMLDRVSRGMHSVRNTITPLNRAQPTSR